MIAVRKRCSGDGGGGMKLESEMLGANDLFGKSVLYQNLGLGEGTRRLRALLSVSFSFSTAAMSDILVQGRKRGRADEIL